MNIFPKEQPAAAALHQHEPEDRRVCGYRVDHAGMFLVPDDGEADIVSALQFPPHSRGGSLFTDTGGGKVVMIPAVLFSPAVFQR